MKNSKPKDPTTPQAGSKWSPEEEQKIVAAFKANTPVEEIAADHGRTPGAITARLVKLGLIDAPKSPLGRGNVPRPGAPRRSPPAETGQGNRPVASTARPVRLPPDSSAIAPRTTAEVSAEAGPIQS